MAQRIPFYEVWDWQSIRRAFFIIFILSFFFLCYYNLDILNDSIRELKYDGRISGKVYEMEPIYHLKQTFTGTHRILEYYELGYTYTVKDSLFIKQDRILASKRNKKLLRTALNDRDSMITVLYILNKPDHSIVKLSN